MIALPWYLMSGGVMIVVVGLLMAAASSRRDSQPWIDPKMSDDEIVQRLQPPRVGLAGIVVFIGLVCVMVSLVWRIVLIIL